MTILCQVREHNKKLAKNLKNTFGQKKKQSGAVPNMAPFKEVRHIHIITSEIIDSMKSESYLSRLKLTSIV